ncbi:betaine--homocysteine S-methyltransferase 1-like isoform X2 [Lytechinus variegatus]|uniref:betaine--homocysteine S-methyltransferase 1-like isoform X1 n=1 Tax=Lytechinus variegatus TaxID=7654 RepID=UPI001BB26D33|nr:betaine--homocysteine S-methyltransferase 1-like isoform X1 [Lytechinus variegatus]XP_041465762.1 betaine--homocysteine S-methyltransferase 1-like isoform X2 [Lytechinus variegatus]
MSEAKKSKTDKKGFMERLDAGEIVIGDGGYVFALEKRGYVKAGPWTPEATVEHPEAVRQLSKEFLRAGADVIQAFTFYASDDKLENRANKSLEKYTGAMINQRACDIAKEVAEIGNGNGPGLFAGGVCQTPGYLSGANKESVQAIFRKQVKVFEENKVDFLLAEYFEHVEEAVWAVEELKKTGIPVACSLCIGPEGDMHGVSAGDCAVKMAEAGADVIGINCHFDPWICLKGVALMKEGLEKAGLKRHLMIQPLAFATPDCGKQGFIDLPEFPFGLEPRILTRWECHRYAREAYDLGIRYIGGCCGFEPYHIRAVCEELNKERGFYPEGTEKHALWGDGLRQHTKPWVRARARRDYWENLKPSSGRPDCASMSKPDAWGVTRGDENLVQHVEETDDTELKKLYQQAAK